MIELESLSKHFDGLAAVDRVSARLESGTITAVVGTSGSGKTTLLRMINRLIEPDSGRVLIDGQDIRALPPVALRRGIGYAIQGNGLFPHWTAARNIAVVPRLLGWPREKIAARVRELLELLQLDPAEIGPRYPHQLSGGQAQRIGVARALAARPGVLLMDEPFGALDPVTRRQAQKDLARIQRKLGTTVVLVTHDMAEALLLGDRIAVMRAGRFEQLATPAQIVKSPATPFVSEMVGEEGRALLLLSLMPAATLLRQGDPPPGAPRLEAGASLSEALSQMLWTGARVLALTDAAGEPQGLLQREDILNAARQEAAGASIGDGEAGHRGGGPC